VVVVGEAGGLPADQYRHRRVERYRSQRVTSLAFVQSPDDLGVVKVSDGRTWRFGELAIIVSPWTSRFESRAVLL